MTAGQEQLQRVFKTLSDPTRVRILSLLEAEELAVQELMEVLGMAQSRVSRHLAILREAGLLRDRRDGTYVFYRFTAPAEGPWHDAWLLTRRTLAGDPTSERDAAALARVIQSRGDQARSFFDAVGPEWDALRKVFHDDVLRARAITHLVPPGGRVLDLGTGTGILAAELAGLGLSVLAVDRSNRMLEAARAKFEQENVQGVELRRGEAHDLPLADAELEGAFAHMVLHYLPSPADAIAEMARVVRPGGVVVVVDFERHEQEWMRQELGVTWLGFGVEEIEAWFQAAGLPDVAIERHETPSRTRDLPGTFIAWARRSS
ncbi:MAG: metalloregulator ArsR/SmtB family transcription factor [Proteobacteria bacterium]|nr:metalloregulator ArsR/SmtB family transcription factor [Pseudomonadota bacterium]